MFTNRPSNGPSLASSSSAVEMSANNSPEPAGTGRVRIAAFSGPTATILNSAPLVTGDQARERHGLAPRQGEQGFDLLRPQRLAAPVVVYIEAYSAHPLERDAADLYAPPDGYVDGTGEFSKDRRSKSDVPVHVATLRPEDGLYLLPYMARQRDGSPWEMEGTAPLSDWSQIRQTFFPDGSRLAEEIDRFGLDDEGRNNVLSRFADLRFYRVAPPGGYTHGLPASERTDEGLGDIPPETPGEDFFSYSPGHLAHSPATPLLARICNTVQTVADSGEFDGVIWMEGSPNLEETMYWLNLMIDTTLPLCGNAAQRRHGTVGSEGDRNLVDSVHYVRSGISKDVEGRDAVGAVLIQDQQVFAARDAQKGDARPGGYLTTGGHGGVVATIGGSGGPVLTYWPNRLHTWRSLVRRGELPQSVTGVRLVDGTMESVDVPVKGSDRQLLAEAMPKVTIAKWARFAMVDHSDDPSNEVEIQARIADNLRRSPLAGFVLEGNSPYGMGDDSMRKALEIAILSGMPVVRVGRGSTQGFASFDGSGLFLAGSNLTAAKARILLIACLLRHGSAPPAKYPERPTEAELERARDYVSRLQTIFDTH